MRPEDDSKPSLPDPRELFEQLEREEQAEESSAASELPDPAELFRQMEAESPDSDGSAEFPEELAPPDLQELDPFEEVEADEPAADSLPDPAQLFQELQEQSEVKDDIHLPIPGERRRSPFAPPKDPVEAAAEFEEDTPATGGDTLFQRLKNRFRGRKTSKSSATSEGAIPTPEDLFRQYREESEPSQEPAPPTPEELFRQYREESDAEPEEQTSTPTPEEMFRQYREESEPEFQEASTPSPEELFRQYREESGAPEPTVSKPTLQEPEELEAQPSEPLPSPEELFRKMQEEQNASGLPELPDLDEFKRQLEEEERARLDPDVMTDLSGPERFVPTVSDSFFTDTKDVLPGFRTKFPEPPPPEPEVELSPLLGEAKPAWAKPEKLESVGKDPEDFFSDNEWAALEGRPPEPKPKARLKPKPQPVPEPEPEPEATGESPTGTVRVNYQSNEVENDEPKSVPARARHHEDEALARRKAQQRKRGKNEADSQPEESKKKAKKMRRFSRYKLAIFTRQMAVMLKAGIQLHSSVQFAAESDPQLQPMLEEMLKKIESGYTFSTALTSVSRSFDPVYVGLIQAGEHSGRLPQMLERLADVLEREVELKKRLISTITYPAMLLAVCFAGTLGFLYFVLPTLTPLFDDLGVNLPLPTRILLATREFILPLTVLTVLITILFFLMRDRINDYVRERPMLERRLASIPFRLPIFGDVYEKIVTARVLYSLSTMLDVGITLNQALARSEVTAGNALTAYRLGKARIDLADGVGVTDCFRFNELFTPSALHLISAGEEAAKLADMFQYVARLFDEEVEYALQSASSVAEPIIMVVMGLVVGFITISAALPTIQLLQNFS